LPRPGDRRGCLAFALQDHYRSPADAVITQADTLPISDMQDIAPAWTVYIVRCADGSLYTGISVEVLRRIEEHNSSDQLGARYTRTRRPVELVYCEPAASRSEASRRERDIKRLPRHKKEALLAARPFKGLATAG
jgi:putative endonuclease